MTSNSSKSFLVKIFVPILIVVVIAGIWQVKNQTSQSELNNSQADMSAGVINANPDFSLFVTEEIDLEKLKSYGLPIIIDFGADSCIPCKEMAPVLKELNEELQGKAIVRFVDVWKNQNMAKGYPLRVIPTQIFIDKNGNPYLPEDPEANGLTLYPVKTNEVHVFTIHEGGANKEQLLSALREMGME